MRYLCMFFLYFFSLNAIAAEAIKKNYQPTHESISKHSLPDWYQDAKFGIMIHYGIYSVPAWAPIYNPIGKIFGKDFFYNNPYSEWYFNTMQIKECPTYQYHSKKYGKDFTYDDFVPLFNEALKQWNPDIWSQLFADAGAKYVVFVTKHHDGFLLWPSEFRNPLKPNYIASRDVVGELTTSVRRHGMRMGLYYSGGFDWSWEGHLNQPIIDLESASKKVIQSQDYADYVTHHWNELIDTYAPDLLWNDIALPAKINKLQLFANYYNKIPQGVINNRWEQGDSIDFTLFGQPNDILLDVQLKKDWFDYYSPEYLPSYKLTRHKWEADHGPGYTFGYNQEEELHPEHLITLDQLIEDLADLVSKNGNLLLGIAAKADGTIPEYQQDLLRGIGDWLSKNGEAIYATKPWKEAEGHVNENHISTRYTLSKDEKYLYIILLKNPGGQEIIFNLHEFHVPFKKMEVLNGQNPIETSWRFNESNLIVSLPNDVRIPKKHALVLKLERVYV